jgi:hypothetical protein
VVLSGVGFFGERPPHRSTPAPTRMPCAQRLLKWSQQKPTPESEGGGAGKGGPLWSPVVVRLQTLARRHGILGWGLG